MFRGAFTPSARAAPPLRAPTHGEPALQCLLPIARLGFVSFYNSHPDGSDVDSHCLRPGTAHFLEENTGSGWRGNFTTWVLAAIFWVRHQKHRQEQTRGGLVKLGGSGQQRRPSAEREGGYEVGRHLPTTNLRRGSSPKRLGSPCNSAMKRYLITRFLIWAKDSHEHSFKEDIRMPNKHVENARPD